MLYLPEPMSSRQDGACRLTSGAHWGNRAGAEPLLASGMCVPTAIGAGRRARLRGWPLDSGPLSLLLPLQLTLLAQFLQLALLAQLLLYFPNSEPRSGSCTSVRGISLSSPLSNLLPSLF